MGNPTPVLINGLSMGSGGGLTVGRELTAHLASALPNTPITLALTEGHFLHETLRRHDWPSNVRLFWGPRNTIARMARRQFEVQTFPGLIRRENIGCVVQLSGLGYVGLDVPVICHMQDPWPYRPQAWERFSQRWVCWLKRRAHRRSIEISAAVTWTSRWLEQIVTGRLRITPKVSEVIYNGLPADAIARAASGQFVPDARRRDEIVTVSNVGGFKRQDLVIRALPGVIERTGLKTLRYRVIGHAEPWQKRWLARVAARAGVSDRVSVEGWVEQHVVDDALAHARAFVLMSLCESFGIPALEAMSHGTPAVISDCCAHSEIAADAAVLTPPDDLPKLVDNLSGILTDPSRRASLIEAGRWRTQDFPWSRTAELLAGVIRQVTRH